MSNKKVYIRVDGSAEIGLGHLVRCLALAQMLQSEFEVSFFSRLFPESIKNEIVAKGFDFTELVDELSFFECLTGYEIVVLDNYFFDTDYQKRVKEKGCKLVCIDDIHDKDFFADLIINHAPGIKESDYQAQDYTQFALGLDYALLRPEFLEAAKQKHNKLYNRQSVLICFGGSDAKNLTLSCLKQIQKISVYKQIHIVLGAAYQYRSELEQIANTDQSVNLHNAISSEMMLQLMQDTELIIVPASGILFEALAVGCKVISGMYVDNQREVLRGFVDLDSIANAGGFSEFELNNALGVVNLKNWDKKLIDGKSGVRICNLLNYD